MNRDGRLRSGFSLLQPKEALRLRISHGRKGTLYGICTLKEGPRDWESHRLSHPSSALTRDQEPAPRRLALECKDARVDRPVSQLMQIPSSLLSIDRLADFRCV